VKPQAARQPGLEGKLNQAYDSGKKNQPAKQIWVFKLQRESAITSLWWMLWEDSR
jgi:hypothetical protein